MARPGLVAVVLAAGQGTRMKSALPKVLHEVAGRPMVVWAVAAALEAGAERALVVVGHGREQVESALRARFGGAVDFVHQAEQRGTGHALTCALPSLGDARELLLTYGDCPLVTASTLGRLVALPPAELALVTTRLPDPTGYGRILRDAAGVVCGIREHKDASDAERAITEVNPGLYRFEHAFVAAALPTLASDNAQGEIYLTDLVARAPRVVSFEADEQELRGVNDGLELARANVAMHRRIAEGLARSGVRVDDPHAVYVDADAVVEAGARLAPGVHLRGRTAVASGAFVDVGSVLSDVAVGPGAVVKPYTVASSSRIGEGAEVGPFSHLRPETELGKRAKVGNFTETKKTVIGEDSKVNHLAYVGDGIIGAGVNVGAGTIFCNYDGFMKHTTVLEDGVFIGSDSQLVAPVRVGAGAYVASGTTVTRDVPPDALAIGRAKQENKEGLASRLRAKKAAEKADRKRG